MNEKFNAIAPRVASLVRMFTAPTEGEKLNAVQLLLQQLASVGLDIHALAERIVSAPKPAGSAKPSLDEAQIQRVYDTAYRKGFADGSEHGRKSAIVAGASKGVFSTDVGSGVN